MSHGGLGGDGFEAADAEELQSGPSRGLRSGPRRIRPWVVRLAIVVLVATVATVAIVHGGQSHSRRTAAPRLAAPSAQPQPALPRGPARAAPPLNTTVKLPLLGITAGWELFGRGSTDVVRIQFARGVVTRTTVPALQSSGPVSFAVGPQGALIRPLDFVPGYLVPDGHFARRLPGRLSHGGALVAGPRLGQFWVQDAARSRVKVSLVGPTGHLVGTAIRLPFDQAFLASDGSGYVLAITEHGGYDVRPGRLRKIPGNIQAVGPAGLLTRVCDRRTRCRNLLVDPRDGRRSAFGREVDSDTGEQLGVIAAGGRFVALPNPLSDGPGTIRLVDLRTGVDHTLRIPLPAQDAFGSGLAFSPDGRWLFAATASGKLLAVRTSTGRIRTLGVALPQLSQLVVRPAYQRG